MYKFGQDFLDIQHEKNRVKDNTSYIQYVCVISSIIFFLPLVIYCTVERLQINSLKANKRRRYTVNYAHGA